MTDVLPGAAPPAGYIHRQAVYQVVISGQDITRTVRRRLMSLRLSEKRGSDADELTIVLDDADGKVNIPPAGAVISLRLGWLDLATGAVAQLIDKGSFKVDAREHGGTPDVLTISAKSADLTRAFRRRRTQTWSNTTLGAVLADVAARNGYQARVAPDKAAIVVDHLDQARESDAAFLNRLGRLHDAVATIKADRLIFSAIGAGETSTGVQIPRARLTRMSGDRHRWKAAERDSYSGVTARWRDRAGAQIRTVTVGSGSNAKTLGRIYASEAAARRAADNERSRQDRRGATFGLALARGRPDLYPERAIEVVGFKPEIDAADWLIVAVDHAVDSGGGLTTSLEMELGSAGQTAPP